MKRPVLIGGAAALLVAVGLASLFWPEAPQDAPEPVVAERPPSPPPDEPTTARLEVPPPEPVPAPPPQGPAPAAIPAPPAATEQAALPPPPTPPVEPPPRPPVVDGAAVAAALAGLPCVHATAEVAEGGRVELAGIVPDAELADRARTTAREVPGVQDVVDRFEVVPAPGCVAAATVESALVGPTLGPLPELRLNSPDGVYRNDDFIVLTAAMPEGSGGFLYVDVLTDAGTAVHLLPEELTPANQLPAGGSIKIGVEEAERRAGVRDWQVAPPFGPGYILVVASEQPLYEGSREIEEPLQDYLDVLLPALKDPARGAKSVRVERIEFRERG